ncbi:MAG: triose-phosphate isomerase [Planctomycetota bacterium]|jgi:triosephosphate isomerase
MRTPLMAGNWKMHCTAAEAKDLAGGLRERVEGVEGVSVLLCPPFTALAAVRGVIEGSSIALGAQDLYWEEKGAFTGQVSAPMLLDAGCRYVIVGHSERRHVFGETDQDVNRKTKAALAHGLVPIVCVGELLEEREKNVTEEVVSRQIIRALDGLEPAQVAGLVIAYEPVWAIGTGKTATPAVAQDAHRFIRGLIAGRFGEGTAKWMRIQYGGSVKPGNVAELMAQPDIDGALVGGASLKVDSFARIVRFGD